MNKKPDILVDFEDLPVVNYNLYIGAGKDACDYCLEFEEARDQIKSYIRAKIISVLEEVGSTMGKEIIIEEKITGERKNYRGDTFYTNHFTDGYNQALKETKEVIDKIIKRI
jgi:hypothetical protein